ncbi:putative dioxygenase [Colletotrichum shisoi]|uniref:Putative dioxygenase n=1 Tax=Colletotrichum shisoi TaxID=2078593 RepID=A0A5Q4C2E6_9PEZI|nr:putative dioxygenase [Colletotrichum shisoi]
MKSAPGLTPFFCCSQLYEELMREDERQMADNSWVEYAAFPQGKELTEGEVKGPRPDEAKIRRYPMVWVNPATGRKCFQVQSNAARKLFIRRSPGDEVRVVDDLVGVRRILLDIQLRILKPEYILIPPEEEGDLLLWDNWATMHSRVDYPARYGPKLCHQAGTNAKTVPVGPAAAPVF